MKYEPDQTNDYALSLAIIIVFWLVFMFGMHQHDVSKTRIKCELSCAPKMVLDADPCTCSEENRNALTPIP